MVFGLLPMGLGSLASVFAALCVHYARISLTLRVGERDGGKHRERSMA
jgi:hypothetical protein